MLNSTIDELDLEEELEHRMGRYGLNPCGK